MPITFTKVALPYGWLGNMAPLPLQHRGKCWRTAEALFQALRFEDEAIKEAIRAAKSPMRAKWIAQRFIKLSKHTVVPQSAQDLAHMEVVLRLKLEQHPELRWKLLATGNRALIEDCSRRPSGSGMFWGAARRDGKWRGANTLGRLWMKLREELRREVGG